MSGPILAVENLEISFRTGRGRLRALRRVGLSVPRDRVVGVVGESGCGKSTLIAAIMGLLPGNASIDGGAIRFGGRDLVGLGEDDYRPIRGPGIAMIFQDPMTSLNPVLSIGRQMTDIQYREPLSRRDKRDRASAMLATVGIPDPVTCLDLHAHQLSGGMRQRVAIGMALLMQPSLLIADEPTTALDATTEAQIARLFAELRESFSGSILLVSHNLGLIASLCDEIAVMYAGEVVETGPVRALFHAPRHPYTRLLLDCDPARIAGRPPELPTIAGAMPDLVRVAAGCAFAPRCPRALPLCATAPPPLHAVAADHHARCHLVADAALA